MFFYSGDLSNFNLCKFHKDIDELFFVKKCVNGITVSLEISKKGKDIRELLKENRCLYYSFGKRAKEYLICADGNKYLVDDDRDENSQGIYMSDAYFNQYEDINIGFMIKIENDIINVQSAIEEEGINCRTYETIEDCGDLNIKMKDFINTYII